MNEFVFTAAGQQLVSRMIAGEATAAFTRVETSDHEYTKNEVEMLTALADVKQEVLISKVTRVDPAKVELLIALDNRDVKETYNVIAIGVYARDSDQQEILFGVAVNTDTPDPMPVLAGKTISELTYHLVLAVAVSDQIDISVIPSAGATVEQLEELKGNVNEKVEQLLEKTRSLQSELEDVQNELRSVVKQTAIVNNNTTTEAGFALDARQANPTIEGTMANQILQLNNDLLKNKCQFPINGLITRLSEIKLIGTYYIQNSEEMPNINGWYVILAFAYQDGSVIPLIAMDQFSNSIFYGRLYQSTNGYILDSWNNLCH